METAPDHDSTDNTKRAAVWLVSRGRVSRPYAEITQIERLVDEASYRTARFNEPQSESHVLTFQNAVLLRLDRCPYFLANLAFLISERL